MMIRNGGRTCETDMARKLPNLEHVKFVRRFFGGREVIYAYFNTGQKKDGKPIYKRMPGPSEPRFYESYAALKAGRTKRATKAFTVANLVDLYLSSREYGNKAKSTQDLYRIQLLKAAKLFAEAPANELTREDVELVLDQEGWGAGSQNAFVGALGAAYKWARTIHKKTITADPVKGIERRKMGEHDPWPDDILTAALACNDPRIRLAVHLLYCTGQRIGDVCAMRWGQIKDGYVTLTQEKTGTELTFPVAAELRAELDQTTKRGLYVLTNDQGQPLRQKALREAIIAFTIAQGKRCVPHGLRKNAVNTLLEAGCTVYQVSAITGQSLAMIEHYAAKVDRKKLGTAAMLKFDANRRKSS